MMKFNRILSAATAMVMAFTMFAGAVSLDAVNDNESEEIFAPPEAYEIVHHLTENKTRGTSVPRHTYDLSENSYRGSFIFDSSLYSNYLFKPDGKSLFIQGESAANDERPVKVFTVDVLLKNTLGFEIHKSIECPRNGVFSKTVSVDNSKRYFLCFRKAIDGVKLTGNFSVA